MKKLILLFIMMLGFISSTFADVLWYRASSYAQASVNRNGVYTWGDWEKSTVKIKIDTENDRIVIYSPRTQIYEIYSTYNDGEAYRDNKGGWQVKFYAIDQDNDKGTIRIRIEDNGSSQIYCDFANCAWVYTVTRIN